MEKPSRLLAPLVVAAASLTPVHKANALDNGNPGLHSPTPITPIQFCEKLRNASGPDVNDSITFFSTNDHGIDMTIKRAIKTVMEDGQEATLSCTYDATKGAHRVVIMDKEIPVESFSRALFSPTGGVLSFAATTPNAEYGDYDLDGFPDRVDFNNKDFFTYVDAIGSIEDAKQAFCIEEQAPDVCETFGVGLSDFDAAIEAGRRALNIGDK